MEQVGGSERLGKGARGQDRREAQGLECQGKGAVLGGPLDGLDAWLSG